MEQDPISVFLQEATELLDGLESALLDLSQSPKQRDLIDVAFRALHTIKGSGAMFGFDQVATFTHELETAFDLLRQGRVEPSRDIIAVALAAKDHIRALLDDPVRTDPAIGHTILDSLREVLGSAPSNGPPPLPAADELRNTSPGWTLFIAFDTEALRNGTNPLALLDDLRALGPCHVDVDLAQIPPLEALDPCALLVRWTVELGGTCSRADIEDVFLFERDQMTLEITPLQQPDNQTPSTIESDTAHTNPSAEVQPEPVVRVESKTATIRVQAERLDELMDRVGELVIAQARLSQLAKSGIDPAIKSIAEEIERLASRLRDTTMGIRMVPIGALFGRFRRLIHDLSRDLGKPVDFVTTGEDTELDKTMIERLADPLVHLIRNAIDHGIESAEQRAATNKPATGCIELSARYVGAQVLVTIRDDGGGLDAARIRAKAEESGLIAPGAPLTDQEIYQFLFYPGFSTASKISALSGRGVGMDVVKRTIDTMRGSIDLATTRGGGSIVTLRLPLTLAIIDGLLIRVGEGRYIIPLPAVEECIEMRGDEGRDSRRSFLNIRGDLVPYLKLRELFTVDAEIEPHPKIIIISTGETRVGLVVDQIIGSHQTVIKSLSKLHADAAMFSGATILGDGTAALILDVAQLVSLSQSRADSTKFQEAA